MERKVYQEMARALEARNNCIKSNNEEWQFNHEQTIIDLIKGLPHGSGIDGTTSFDFERSKPDRLVIHSEYHHMNDGGYYDGWSEFSLIITSSLSFGFNLKITGSFPRKYSDTKDYLHEVFSNALDENIQE